MSKGFGAVQRDILAQFDAHAAGSGLLVGDAGWPYRRAAYALERAGMVRLEYRRIDGKRRLVAYRILCV